MNISRVVTPAFLRFARTCWVKQETSPSVLRRTLRGVISPILSDEFSDIRLRMEASSLAVAIVARLDDFPPERSIDIAAVMNGKHPASPADVFCGPNDPMLDNEHYIFGLKLINMLAKYNSAEAEELRSFFAERLIEIIKLELKCHQLTLPKFQQLLLETFNLFLSREDDGRYNNFILSRHIISLMGNCDRFNAELFDQAVLAYHLKVEHFSRDLVYSWLIRFEPFRRTFALRLKELDSSVAWKAEYARAWFDFLKFGPVEIESFNSGRF
ncbi:MAG: hypothetical protein ABIJ26_06835 [Candidatus Margulisiibacteriota bacterium]|nr:hypothetical protein [Candidatus Margulisiibacteriota bacterium]